MSEVFTINKHLAGACHLALWAFLFLSPLTYWRGTGITFEQYLMYCMNPLFQVIVFYLNYLYLAPKFFVAGKHRYDLLINLILVTVLGITLHYWMDYTNTVYPVAGRHLDAIDDFTRTLRNILNLAIFAAGSTALASAIDRALFGGSHWSHRGWTRGESRHGTRRGRAQVWRRSGGRVPPEDRRSVSNVD